MLKTVDVMETVFERIVLKLCLNVRVQGSGSSVIWTDLAHSKKAQGKSIFSFPYTLFLHIFDT